MFGHPLPVDAATLRSGGPNFLTAALRASGALGQDISVAAITGLAETRGGSTGRKAVLSVRYDTPAPALPTELFVKFSRDLDDPIRDRGKTQMAPEVRFAALSRAPEFPIAVPQVLFADYHQASGTGILITERIPFGSNGIERQYHKCLDHEMPEPVEHYRVLLTALARLAGTHKSGRLPLELTAPFALDLRAATVGEGSTTDIDKLDRRLTQLATLVQSRPGLLPATVVDGEFLIRLRYEVSRIAAHEDTIVRHLAADSDCVALCHWNANVDNAWFWRDVDGALQCGLLDWGCVGQMNIGMAVWGAMSAAETDLWNNHFGELLDVFVTEFQRCGGPEVDADRLRRHTLLYAASMGAAWLLDVPALLGKRFGADLPHDRMDSRIKDDESLRAPLQMLANLLYLWQRHPIVDLLEEATGKPASLSEH
ncbi:hypothetical protein A5634_13345 [Mycobacterium asiaticum]|uniref:Aminoglycoside phosphotransferase domain-containing protein n=1 Tax=Mycobacterium asiaticum TaxID=1790 RepID=A0A1A3PDA1_MYCAS|nr:hypothetical protein [Mycobacterium asiaticum]OBK31675.1 hypothetical protein A5634_13345 [Mycobacterium asiaticum]